MVAQAAAQAAAPAAAPLTLQVYNADAGSFHVNAVLVSGKTDAVLLDGRHDWWAGDSMLPQVPVRMQVKGDASCCVIAAASVSARMGFVTQHSSPEMSQ